MLVYKLYQLRSITNANNILRSIQIVCCHDNYPYSLHFSPAAKIQLFFNFQFIFLEKSSELIIIDFNFQEKIGVLLLNKNNKTFKIPSNPYPMSHFKLIYYHIEANGILFKNV